MKKKQPYRFWSRMDLYIHCKRQANEFGFDLDEIKDVVYSEDWDPILEFNGCNLVQDVYHPFYPCLKHDYDWIVGKGGIEADRTFYNNLIKADMVSVKARIWFLGVRLGWLCYYKWKK